MMPIRVFFLVSLLMLGMPTHATVPPPPPPRPFDDSSIAARFDAWRNAYDRSISEAASKPAKARITIRAPENQGGVTEAEKEASREFAIARRKSHDQLNELAKIHWDVKSSASAGDLQRLQETLNWQREFFFHTERNTLEVLETLIN